MNNNYDVFSSLNKSVQRLASCMSDLNSLIAKGTAKRHSVKLPKDDFNRFVAKIEDSITRLVMEPKPCLKCRYWHDAQDLRVAEDTVSRLCNNPNNIVTKDEAENLAKILRFMH